MQVRKWKRSSSLRCKRKANEPSPERAGVFLSTGKTYIAATPTGSDGCKFLRMNDLWLVNKKTLFIGKKIARKSLAMLASNAMLWPCHYSTQETPRRARERRKVSSPTVCTLHPLTFRGLMYAKTQAKVAPPLVSTPQGVGQCLPSNAHESQKLFCSFTTSNLSSLTFGKKLPSR